MKMLARAAVGLFVVLCALVAVMPTHAAPTVQNCTLSGTYVPCNGVQEGLALATANVAASAQKVYGGNYILAQICTTYGSVAFQVLGPDAATYETVASKTTSDTTGGTAVQLQGGATVKATLSGTAGCNVTLTRVP